MLLGTRFGGGFACEATQVGCVPVNPRGSMAKVSHNSSRDLSDRTGKECATSHTYSVDACLRDDPESVALSVNPPRPNASELSGSENVLERYGKRDCGVRLATCGAKMCPISAQERQRGLFGHLWGQHVPNKCPKSAAQMVAQLRQTLDQAGG